MKQEECANCKFWLEGEFTDGSCRRYPPVVSLDEEMGFISTYPRTEPDDWCGEWQWKRGPMVDVTMRDQS